MTTTQTRPYTERPLRRFTATEYLAMADAGILREDELLQLTGGRILYTHADAPRLFSVEDFYALAAADILTNEERVELIDGEIFVMSDTAGPPHAGTVNALARPLFAQIRDRAVIALQNPLELSAYSVVEPDFSILRFRDDFYTRAHPTPEDALLLIEVAHTSLRFDRELKLARYAIAGIPETWIVNIPEGLVETYADPVGGEYRTRRVYRPGEIVSPSAFPDVSIPVSSVLRV